MKEGGGGRRERRRRRRRRWKTTRPVPAADKTDEKDAYSNKF